MGKDYVFYNREEKQWYARVPYFDGDKRKYKYKRAADRTEAKRLALDLFDELEQRGAGAFTHSPKTFADFCDYYKQRYLIPPEYAHGQKVAGLRSYKGQQHKLEKLRAHFGARKLREITHGDLLAFRSLRFRTPASAGKDAKTGKPKTKQRAIASVNRDLELLRAMFAIAYREGFIKRNPFTLGDPLISKAIERRRERVLTREEEARLLAACEGGREHLRAILICALDTGMRRGEIFTLRWLNVDLTTNSINIHGMNTKTLQARSVGITQRLRAELLLLSAKSKDAGGRVFGIEDTIKRSFATAKRIAGIDDLRFHDLRHTAGTRLAEGGLMVSEIARVLGHSNVQTAFRYINRTENTQERAASILDAWQEKGSVQSGAVN